MRRLFAFGLGYSAKALCQRLARDGWPIAATATSPGGVKAIEGLGYDGFLFDGRAANPAVSEALRQASHILVSVPPGGDGDVVLVHHGEDIAQSPGVRWTGYLSTIGVYGDRGGDWVDEETAPAPVSERSKRRLAAEDSWRALAKRSGKVVQIFRLAGIYGPGRSAIDKVAAGSARAIIKPGQVFNRIHVEDIASVVEAALKGNGQQDLYNVSDDEPAPPQDVLTYAARLLGQPPPPEIAFDAAGLSAMARSFYSENKRVRNARIKADLGVTLAFPTYREGLQSILEAGQKDPA